MASETTTNEESASRLGKWFGWFDGSLLALMLGSIAIVVIGGLIQVSFGAYSMSIVEAWNAVFNPDVIFNPQTWEAFLLGGEIPEMGEKSLIVWNIRLPRVFVAIFVGMNLSVSGAIFQAVTRNELASPYILGISSGAGLMIPLSLVIVGGLAGILPLIAAIGGAGAFLLVYLIAWQGGTNPVRLVLAGVIVSTVLTSVQTGLFLLRRFVRGCPDRYRVDDRFAHGNGLGAGSDGAAVDHTGDGARTRWLTPVERASLG